MNRAAVKREGLRPAARLAMGDCLGDLIEKCERQNTAGATVIEIDIEKELDFMRQCASQMRKLHDLVD